MASEKDLITEFLQTSVVVERTRAQRNRAITIMIFTIVTLLGLMASWFAYRTNQQASDLKVAATKDAQQAQALEAAATKETSRLLALGTAQAETIQERNLAEKRRHAAVQAQATAEGETRRAQSGELAVHAENTIANNREDPSLALLLAFHAVEITRQADNFVTVNADRALRDAVDAAPRYRMTLPRNHHSGPVWSAAYSHDNKTIVTAGEDQTARVWDAATGKELRQLIGHSGPVWSAAYSHDDKTIVTAGEDQTARVWDAVTGKELRQLIGHSGPVISAAYSPNDQTIATSSKDGFVRIWNAVTGQELRQFNVTGGSVHFSPDGKRIVVGGAIWDAASGEQLTRRGEYFHTAEYSPDGQTIVTGSDDSTVHILNASTGKALLTLNDRGAYITSVAYSPDGKSVAAAICDRLYAFMPAVTGNCRSASIYIWDAATGNQLRQLAGFSEPFNSVAYRMDGENIVAASYDGTARIWNVVTGEELNALGRDTLSVRDAIYSPDGRRIATIGCDRTSTGGCWMASTRVWDATSGEELLRFTITHTGGFNSVAYSPDNRTIITSGDDETVRIWDTTTKKELRQLHGHTAAVLSADFSPDGKTIVTTSADNTVLIWDADTGEELRQLRNHFDSINSAAYGLDSKTIAITGCAQMDNYICQEGFVSIWDVITGQELHQFRGHSRTILSSAYGSNQGTIVTASDDGTARIWNVATGEGLRQFTGHTGPVWSVAYSPDSKSIVTAGDDGTARIWNVATGEKLRQFTGHTGSVRSVAYSPDGKSIVTAGDDGTVRIWATDTPMHIIGTTDGTNSVWTAAYSPDNKRIFTAGCHRVDKYGRCNATSAYIWDATTGEELIRLPDFISFVNSAAYSPDGKTIAITGCDRANEYGNCNESSAYLWDIASDKELYRFGRDTDTIKFVTYSPDGKTIVITGCDRANEYGNCNESSAYLWDIASGKELHRFGRDTDTIKFVTYSPDGKTIVTATEDATFHIWDVETGAELRRFGGSEFDPFDILAYSPDGSSIVTFGCSGFDEFSTCIGPSTRIWDTDPGEALIELNVDLVNSATFSPDSKTVVTAGSDQFARIWNATTGEELHVLSGHVDTVNSANYSPDNKTIVTASVDKTVRIWDAATGKELRQLDSQTSRVNSAAYSPDGKTIISVNEDGTVHIWVANIDDLLAEARRLVQRDPPLLTPEEQRRYGLN